MVEFDKESSTFTLTRDGNETPFPYNPNSRNVWGWLNDESIDKSFTVILLTNPFLHKEMDYFEIYFNDSKEERGGFLFPISLLESTEPEGTALLSYLFVAYKTLLNRIDDDMEATGVLSDSYNDAYILVVHNQTVPDFEISHYIISLASYGFYEYKGKIGGTFPNLDFFKELNSKKLVLNKSDTNLSNDYVSDLLRNRLSVTCDFITRFVLVYQVVELFISEIHHSLLDEKIIKYKNGELIKNDFAEEIKNISRENYQIEILFQDITDEKVCNEYKSVAKSLFNDVGYDCDEKIHKLFYALRNQVFHNYNIFIGHEDALTETIFYFERVVMMLLAKKRIK